jgi:transglutaminase-like putative cysteine protease
MTAEFSPYLCATPVIDFNHASVAEFTEKNSGASPDPIPRAVSLYYAVRDGIRYDPYSIDLSVEGLRASTTLKTGRGWCVAKAILLAACCRYAKIPARLGFADIRNHLSTERMRQQMKTDIFYWHGYTSIHLDGKWVKATPAFNVELCEKFRIKTLDFDGHNDSIYHPFDLTGNKHMEYLHYRGEFDDAPIDAIKETFYKEYIQAAKLQGADFDREVDQETGQ